MNMHPNARFARTASAPATMRAAVLTAPKKFEVVDVPLPDPGPGEVRVRLHGCGVCASNVMPWMGPEWMNFPTEPGGLGHEGWGIVDALGKNVRNLREGDAVTTLFQKSYADFDVGPACQVIALPPALQSAPMPGEPLGCAVNVLRRASIQPGQSVAVIGLGFLGLLLVRLAVLAGATVVAVAKKQEAQARALRLGAHVAVSPEGAPTAARTYSQVGQFDCVIEATGQQQPLDLAAALTATRGRLVVAGYHQDGSRQVDMQLWNWKGIDVINAHERDPSIYIEGIQRALSLVVEGELDPEPLFTHRLPLERLNEALELAAERPPDFVKSLVLMS